MATRGFNTWRHETWGAPCEGQRIVRSVFGTTGCVQWINERIVPAAGMLAAAFAMSGYDVRSCGAYNCRRITGGTVYSPHAWGIAIDINPGANPYTRAGLVTDIPLSMVEHAYRIVTSETRQRVWKWGGDWDGDWKFDDHTVWDAMHFEVIATPAELAEGVVFDGKLNAEVAPVMFITHGAHSTTVEYWQRKLKRLGVDLGDEGPAGDGVDGIYGDLTAAGVASVVPGSDGSEIGPAEAEGIEWALMRLAGGGV